MDPIAALLDGARARRAFVLRSLLRPPWALDVRDRAPLTLLAVGRGTAWVLHDREPPVRLDAGDLALVRGPDRYVVADDPTTRPTVVVHPGQQCSSIAGDPVSMLGTRTWGHGGDDATLLLTGTYERPSELSDRLLRALPPVATVSADAAGGPLAAVLAQEVDRDEPGQEVVLDRLLDLLLIASLRSWFARPDADAPAWYRARTDPLVGTALALLQGEPERAWTVASLARAVHASRPTLARRFTELVGEPPMRFLTRWRLDLAADLLRDPDATLADVAERVGYGSPFALSAAFKRERGVSPAEHRRLARPA